MTPLPRRPDDHGVPAPLLDLQSTLRIAGGVEAARELLTGLDDYVNEPVPTIGRRHPGVVIDELGDWTLRCDVLLPITSLGATLVFFHGGAWTMGSPASHRRLTSELCGLGLTVVSVDYRRAPRHRFPAAYDDAVTALEWTRAHLARISSPDDLLLVGGDSAGANLAAAAAAACPEADVTAALLLYGIYDYHRALPVLADLVGGASAEEQLYLPAADFDTLRRDPRLSPEARASALPRALIAAGEEDPLLAETLSLADALTLAGRPHDLVVEPGAPHGYLQLPTHPAHATTLRSIERFIRALP